MTEAESARMTEGFLLNGTLQEPAVRIEAAHVFGRRHSLVIDNLSVFGWWVDGDNTEELERIITIKQRREEQTYATSQNAEAFITNIDPDRVHPDLRHLLDPETFTERFGAVTFVRAPGRQNLIDDGILPDRAVSFEDDGFGRPDKTKPVIQNWVPDGKDDVHDVLSYVRDEYGIVKPLVTSLNITGQTEITDPDEAEAFVRRHGLALVLGGTAVRADCEGSFTIVGLTEKPKVQVFRHGNIGLSVMARILADHELEIAENARTVKRPLTVNDSPVLERATRAAARIHALEHLGWTTKRIGSVASGEWRKGGWPQVERYNPDEVWILRAESYDDELSLN